ncbi:aldose epimerase family protein [Marinibacterium sp. SX1]|uniref:aldose epimerase family protein n=1 Tax=Marinibacterium sp. SX1 TaxID=3388424 RepID=UPI003D17F270
MPIPFAQGPGGAPVDLLRLSNGGTTAQVLTWGATLQDLRLDGLDRGLVLGAPGLTPYHGPMRYFGAVVGPVANRIAGGTAMLDGRTYAFERNEAGRTTLHGGHVGTDARVWTVEAHDDTSCTLSLDLADGEGGFPGNRRITAQYRLDGDGALVLTLTARSDAPSWINLASHAYWSLTGRDGLDDHEMTIAAGQYLPVDDQLIPRGAPAPVAGTRFDFLAPRPVRREGEAMIDHNFCLDPGDGPALTLRGDGLRLEITTDAPGLQIFDATGLHPGPGHDGRTYGPHAGLAIEPQYWPDSPNHPDYPSIRVAADETWQQVSRFHVTRTGDM